MPIYILHYLTVEDVSWTLWTEENRRHRRSRTGGRFEENVAGIIPARREVNRYLTIEPMRNFRRAFWQFENSIHDRGKKIIHLNTIIFR
jgi:hypothetical protein